MVTDLHAHMVPAALAEALAARTHPPCIARDSLQMPIGSIPFNAGFGDLSARLTALDAVGIERQLLSLPGLFGIDSLPVDQAAPLCALFNDAAACAAAAHPDRFAWLASVPLADPAAAQETLRQAVQSGAKGLILSCGAFSSVDAAGSRAVPLLEVLSELGGGHVFVHPGRWPGDPPPSADPYPDLAFARRQLHIQAEITEAAITLLYAPILNPFPEVTVQIANLGGVLAMVCERIAEVARARAIDAPDLTLRPGVWLDCASMGPRAIEIAVGIFGPEAIVLGTDMPIFGPVERMTAIEAADLSPQARAHLLDGGRALWS